MLKAVSIRGADEPALLMIIGTLTDSMVFANVNKERCFFVL
jgi:hypothetical protein